MRLIMKIRKIRYIFQGVFDLKGFNFLFSKDSLKNMVPVFILIIFLPMFSGILNFSNKGNKILTNENRIRVEKPTLTLNSIFPFFKKYEKYYNDNFTFRDSIIHNFNRIKILLFGISPIDSVIKGKNGWLFLSRENGVNLLKYYFSFNNFNDHDMQMFKKNLVRRKNWAESLGCSFLYVIVPNKQTVYPEMMPAGADIKPCISMLESFIDYFNKKGVDFVPDLLKKFVNVKKRRILYQKTDTHWNQFGAYIAYKMIVRSLSEISRISIKPDRLIMFRLIEKEQNGGDLSRMLSLDKKIFRDKILLMERIKPVNFKRSEIKSGSVNGSIITDENIDAKFPPILFIHDSFGEYLKKYLPVHFKKSFYSTERDLKLYERLIKKNGIKFIVEEIAERYFLQIPYEN